MVQHLGTHPSPQDWSVCHLPILLYQWVLKIEHLSFDMQTLAEREAWKLAKEQDLDMVAILPNFVLGPVISSRADGTSVGFLKVCY